MRGECRYCGFVAEWTNESCWCGALSNPERKPTHPENMKKEEKIIQLLEMIVKQNEEIIKNQNIWRTLPTVPVPPNIDPHFGKDIPYVPYKGPDCKVLPSVKQLCNRWTEDLVKTGLYNSGKDPDEDMLELCKGTDDAIRELIIKYIESKENHQ